MIRFSAPALLLLLATPALADSCTVARAALAAAGEARERSHEAGKRYIDEHPSSFLCDPLFLTLMDDEVSSIEGEKAGATLVRAGCASNQHFVDEIDVFMPKVDADLAGAKRSRALIDANCPAKRE